MLAAEQSLGPAMGGLELIDHIPVEMWLLDIDLPKDQPSAFAIADDLCGLCDADSVWKLAICIKL